MIEQRTADGLPGWIPLSTRLGLDIPNEQVLDVDPSQEARLRNALQKKFKQVAIERRPPSGVYNCHGLTFANRRTAIHDASYVPRILNDDGYQKIKLSDVLPGDLVVYYEANEPTHSGVVLRVIEGKPEGVIRSPEIMSKWGAAGEYVHRFNEGPYSDSAPTFWTDRP